MDDQFQTYVNRVVGITQPSYYQQQLSVIHASPKYQRRDGQDWSAVPFPGCTVISSPSGEDPDNQLFYESLRQVQSALASQLPADFLIPLPADSLHITLADLLWADHFRQAQRIAHFQTQLHQEIAQVFSQMADAQTAPIRFQAVGYMVMARALGICLVPATQAHHERIYQLRRALYQQPGLLALGIEQQYLFTAHITLGYFGEVPASLDAAQLAQQLSQLNQSSIVSLPEFVIRRAELRQFDNMTHYYREPEWPVLEF